MFYKPKFCCNCGEKIERIDWTPLTSRRFCEFCAVENKQHDLIPKAFIAIAVAFGLYGFGASLKTVNIDSTGPRMQSSQISKPAKNFVPNVSRPAVDANTSSETNSKAQMQARVSDITSAGGSSANPAPIKQLRHYKPSSDEPVYFCGAMTKKGTPCSRKVKSKGRCWQHSLQSSTAVSTEN